MNILALNWRDMEHPEAGGAEVHAIELFSRLAGMGHGVTLLTTRFKGCSERIDYRGIEILRRGNNILFNRQAPFIIKQLLKERRFDCIVDDVNKLPFYSNRRFPQIPCGVFFHHLFGRTVFGLAPPHAALYVYLAEKFYARGYGKTPCCAVSPSTAKELVRRGFDERNLTVIENGIDTALYRPDDSVKREGDLLLYAGRLKRYKRVDAVFEAMKILENNGRVVRLAVVGAGDDMPRLKKRSQKLGLEDRVEFTGFVDENKKIEYMRRAAIFVNPSEKEGWGITNVEAAACGMPVAANNAPGLRDSVVDNETGLLYDENDVRSLASSIQKLLDDGRLRERLGINARAWAEKFSWDASARRVEDWLLKIVSEK